MFPCARTRCRNRYQPSDDTVDIKDLPNHFEVQYILQCGHSLCEKCLYMAVQSDERSYVCDQCRAKTTFSARAFSSIKGANLSNSSKINRLNANVTAEIPIDAYSFGLAFCEGHLNASPVEIDASPDDPKPTMESNFKYSKDGQDEDNAKLKELIPPARRNKTIPLIATMYKAVDIHAECGNSLKVLGNLERKLTKEFFEAKMCLREKFQTLHSLLQLEEGKGVSQFEETYKRRKEEFTQLEKHLHSVRHAIRDTFQLEHDTMDQLTKKRNKLKESIAKPCRISWRNYEIDDEFKFTLDQYLISVIKNCLHLKPVEKATALTVTVAEQEGNSFRDQLPLFRSPPLHVPQIPAPGSSLSPSDLPGEESEPGLINLAVCKATPCQVLVKMSRIFSPHLFYVTLWNEKEKNRMLLDQIEKWCTQTYTHPPSVASLKPGEFIFVFYDAVSRWTRARLLKLHSDPSKAYLKKSKYGESLPSAYGYYSSISADVQLVDYGGVERVTYSRIRQPFDELFDPEIWPYLALKCSLARVDSKGAEWSPEAITAMEDYCQDALLQLQIFAVEGDLHKVNFNYGEGMPNIINNATIREILIYGGHAIYGSQYNPSQQLDYDSDSIPLSFINPEKIPTSRPETVLITAITNPDLFYVTRYSCQEKFLELHEKLKIYFDLEEPPYIVYTPKKDLPCVALDEGAFYRVTILNLLEPDKVQVHFVDFGTTKVLDVAKLRLIRDEFLRPPIHAIPCKLGDIGPIGFNWTDEAIRKFQELCFGGPSGNSHLFNLSVINYDRKGKHIVNLRRYTGIEYMSVNVALVSLKFALSTGPITEIPADATMLSQYETKLDDRIFKALEDFDVNGYVILRELVTRNREAESSKIDSYVKIRVSHWITPDEFYVQITTPEVRSYFVCYENKLVDDFHLKLDDPVPASLWRLEVNEPVVFAQVEEYDVIWRRGLIIGREAVENPNIKLVESGEELKSEIEQDKPKTKYTVLARDFGYKIQIPRKHIFQLPDDSVYLKDGDFCIKCHICDIIPAGGGVWTKTALEGFDELLKRYQHNLLLHIPERYLPSDQPKSLGVDIIAKDDFIPNGLAPAQVKFLSFKNLLVTRGLAIPTQRIDLGDIDDNPDNEEFPVKRSLIPYTNRKGDTVLGYIRNARANIQRQMDNTIVRFYKEPEKPKEQTFIGLPTEIGSDLKIWFRIQRLEGHQLISIVNRSITNAMRNQDQFLPFAGEFLFGRACTAFFEFDQTWNRAEILYPLDDERTFIRFVDYGNEVAVTKKQLSSQVFHPEIPKLALNGLLSNCKCTAQGHDLVRLQTQIHELIVDHKCVFKWNNFQSLKEMRLSVIMPDGADLVEYLLKNNKFIEEDITDDQTLVSIPPMVRDILQRIPVCGFKSSTLKFEENIYYPVVITGTFRETFTFIQPKPISYPANETEEEINKRNKAFLSFLTSMRSEVDRFESAKEYQPGDPVAAEFSDCQWYRGIILELTNSIFGHKYRVFYVDYGNTSVVDLSKLKKLPIKYRESPELFAIPARVCNIKPGKIGRWSSYLLDLMERELSLNEHNTIACIKSRTDPWDIEVYIADSADPRVPVSSLWKPLVESGQLIEIDSKPKSAN